MLSKIETLSGCQVKSNEPLTWEKTGLELSNYRKVQIILTTNNTGKLQIQITGFNEEKTLSKVIVDKLIRANGESHVFTINTDDFAHDGLANCDIKVTAMGTAKTAFSVLALYINSRHTEIEKSFGINNTEEDFEEEDVELVDYKFSGNIITKCTQKSGAIQIPTSYKIMEGKFYKGDEIPVTSIGNEILWEAQNYDEVIVPDSVINFPVYGFKSTLDTSCRKIITGNGFGRGILGTYPFGHANSCDTIECGTGLTKIDAYIFGATSTVQTLKFATENPPTLTGTGWVGTLKSLQQIFVPQSGLDNWKTATNWNTFASKMVGY